MGPHCFCPRESAWGSEAVPAPGSGTGVWLLPGLGGRLALDTSPLGLVFALGARPVCLGIFTLLPAASWHHPQPPRPGVMSRERLSLLAGRNGLLEASPTQGNRARARCSASQGSMARVDRGPRVTAVPTLLSKDAVPLQADLRCLKGGRRP